LVAAKAEGRRFEPLYTANRDADVAIWASVYEPSGRPVFDGAVQAVRAIQETGFVVPPNAAPREVRTAWMRGVRRALRREVKPDAAMREANAQAQAALDAAG
jgi:multiple sugar transport system substrate-binding protein